MVRKEIRSLSLSLCFFLFSFVEFRPKKYLVYCVVRHFLKNQTKNFQRRNAVSVSEGHEDCEHLEVVVKKLSLAWTTASLDHDQLDPFATLSSICGQSSPSTLKNAFSKYWFVSYPHPNLLMCSSVDILHTWHALLDFLFYALLYVCHELCR
jgi:hypothetical protein